jgi:hypothetical protein
MHFDYLSIYGIPKVQFTYDQVHRVADIWVKPISSDYCQQCLHTGDILQDELWYEVRGVS